LGSASSVKFSLDVWDSGDRGFVANRLMPALTNITQGTLPQTRPRLTM